MNPDTDFINKIKAYGISHVALPTAARILGVSRQAVHKRVNNGTLETLEIDGFKVIPVAVLLREIEKEKR